MVGLVLGFSLSVAVAVVGYMVGVVEVVCSGTLVATWIAAQVWYTH